MKSVTFCFVTHNHQPFGNFDHVIEDAYRHSYLPFFKLASKYPAFRFASHFTGILFNWIHEQHPEHIELLRTMVQRTQLECVAGGFYEPILSVIPEADASKQIALLVDKIRDLTSYTASGMWLAERVWEQQLVSTIAAAGLSYVLLDDSQFLAAGLLPDDLTGYYITEDAGKTLAVVPMSKELRYTIPFQSVDETIRVLRDAASEDGTRMVCFADDGEKFGVWPKTYDHVYTSGWLEEFIRKIGENSNWIRMQHPAEVVSTMKPRGRIYLPTGSYAEMSEWSLPTADAALRYERFLHELPDELAANTDTHRFVKGGYWRNFFVKYTESNQLHKHMLRTSARIEQLRARGRNVQEAERALLAAQCNDPYWHGVFGGVYLPNLRHANYTSLIKADESADRIEPDRFRTASVIASEEDYDGDGRSELILESEHFALFISPESGGMITELDFKPAHLNVINSITRHEEAYHSKIKKAVVANASGESHSIHDQIQSKEAGLEKALIYDWYRRGSMLEHLLPNDITIKELIGGNRGESFATNPFAHHWDATKQVLELEGAATVQDATITLRKSLTVSGDRLSLTYHLKNVASHEVELHFASEWIINFLAGDAPDRYVKLDGVLANDPRLSAASINEHVTSIQMVDEWLRCEVTLAAPHASTIARFPIESVSLSESGVERVYQGTVILPIWTLTLAAQAEESCSLQLDFRAW